MTDLLPPPLSFSVPNKSQLLLLSLLLFAVLFVQHAGGAGVNYVTAPREDARPSPLMMMPDPPTPEELYMAEQEPWIALVVALTKLFSYLVEPYVTSFPSLPLDWSTVMKNINRILDKSSLAIGPLRAAVVGVAAMAVPIIIQVGRTVVDGMASLLDNTVFVVTGHALGRRSVPRDVTEELTDVALRLVHLVSRHLGR